MISTNSQKRLKIALVHDYLNEFGGAERVLLALSEIYPNAPIYTAFYKEGSTAHERFKKRKIITSWAQSVPFFSSILHSPLRFLAPLIWNSFDFSKYDVVIGSSSWYVTKGFRKGDPSTRFSRSGFQPPVEICYCHTPPRYLYGYTTSIDWKKNPLIRIYGILVNHFMRVYDFEAAQRVYWFIANSKEVAGRIKKFYRRDSTVIYPPVDVDRFQLPEIRGQKHKTGNWKLETGYFLVVSRLVASKNVDLAVEVCRNLNLPLKIVGTGRELERLKRLASRSYRHSGERSDSRIDSGQALRLRSGQLKGSESNRTARMTNEETKIEFLGDVDDDQLIKLYQNCRAVIFAASDEDFGIVPVEAMAAGKPVIALAEGGVKETTVDGKTGLLVENLAPGAFVIAIKRFMEMEKNGKWDSNFIRKHAEKFSKERFKREMKSFVERKLRNT